MVSIILPVYHVENYIEACLESLIKQTYKDIEIICVNDCSQDNSITIIKDFQKKDKRIRLINHVENRGLGGARNTGIKEAKGEYIVFIDSDDYVDITMIEKLYKALISTQSDAAICGVMLDFESDHSLQAHTSFHYDILVPESKYDLSANNEILTDMWPSAWNKLYKTSIIREYNLRYKERILYEDHTFFYEYFSHCDSFIYVDEPLYFYRQQRPQSITTQSVGREKEIFTILNYIGGIFDDIYPIEVKEGLYLKIVIRLLYERRWVFNSQDREYYNYLRKVSEYLEQWDKSRLLKAKDAFIPANDPIFLSCSEIDALEADTIIRKYPLKERVKWKLRQMPGIRQMHDMRNNKIKYRNDFYWYIPQIFDTVQGLKKKEDTSNTINQKIEKLEEHTVDLCSSLKLSSEIGTSNILEKMESIIKENEMLQSRIANLESSSITSKNKIDEIWWLTWNIKDHTVEKNSDAALFRWYPTWIPTEFPEYFKGNIWIWPDRFKQYYLSNQETYKAELEKMIRNLTEEDADYLQLLWERNIKIIPYSAYVKDEAFLIKRDFLFTSKEINEQQQILRKFNDIISNYFLPEGATYEIPVFYYEHGLKNFKEEMLEYVKTGDVLDLGGFIGDSALVLSKYTDQTIYSVEMNDENIDKMKLVFKMNRVSNNIIPIHGAVGRKDGVQSFYGENSSSTIYPMENNTEFYQKKETVHVYAVDTLVSNNNIHPHFMKLDVEGAEFDTILGAKETICKYRPILCISIYHTAIDFLRIKPLLESWNLNYKFKIENHNPFDPVYEKMLICIPEELI